jgi:hypothetical protein
LCSTVGSTRFVYAAVFFACFLTFAHLFLAAFAIAALPPADSTRFLTPLKGDCRKALLAAKASNATTRDGIE